MPFDKQCLVMKFASEMPTYQLQFAPLSAGAGNVQAGASVGWKFDSVPVEWQVCRSRTVFGSQTKDATTLRVDNILEKNDTTSKTLVRSSFAVVIHIERNPRFYLWNMVFVLFFVTLIAGFCIAIPPDQAGNRFQALSTLLVSTVGCKIITSSWLPVKPYLTHLDKVKGNNI